ncbi:hypothetical protein BJ912DRAFT_1023821 [Pholiota molesta]|nr:hypothetical protein BJ912DRAFT_1023821 [Pholiota molesta]
MVLIHSPTPADLSTPSQNKKRKIEEADEAYDEEAEPSASEKPYDSDALDDSDGPTAKPKRKGRALAKESPKKTQSPRKKKKQVDSGDAEYDDLEDGQEVVGMVVQAPKTGHVPAGQISQNTLNFLISYKTPFKLHEPVYRVAEKEWKDFVEAFTDLLVDVDPQIPPLPPKDVIHRIYRDVRFSNDKTPYKKNLRPGHESMIAAGSWCPGRNELANIRTNIQHNSRRLRSFFGKPQPHPEGESQNIFGMEDELKVAPKGVSKDHKDIDLLKCRSFVVMHKFTDSEVLSPDFKETVASVARVMQPLVHWYFNDMMTVMDYGDDSGESETEAENDSTD